MSVRQKHEHLFSRVRKIKGSRLRWGCDACPAVDPSWYRDPNYTPKVRPTTPKKAVQRADGVPQDSDLTGFGFRVDKAEYDREGNRVITKVTPISIDPGSGSWHTVVETPEDAADVIKNAMHDDPQPVHMEGVQTGTARVADTPRPLDEVHTKEEIDVVRRDFGKPLQPLVLDDMKTKGSHGKKPSIQDSALVPEHTPEALDQQTMSTLRNYASELDIRGRSKMDRPKLVEAILNAQKGSNK